MNGICPDSVTGIIFVNFTSLFFFILLRVKAPPDRVGAVEHQMVNTAFTTYAIALKSRSMVNKESMSLDLLRNRF